jgi:N-acyl-D-aspartate/D-glutamate deacylase
MHLPADRPLILRGGLVFDGTGAPGRLADVRISRGVVADITDCPPGEADATVHGADGDALAIDARGAWVMPGFVDLHTHYDAEIEIDAGLRESVRHGVTTCVMGSCGLGMAVGRPDDLADMFCRVEGIPRATVKPLLDRVKDWDDPAGYLDHLERLPLGPNVAVLLGHSTIRAHVLGLGRSLEPAALDRAQLAQLAAVLHQALDAGYLGLSINTLTWDKMDGDAYRSRPTPSTFAKWSEVRALASILRARDRVFQGVPNVSTKWNVLLFALASAGLVRKPLRTMLITMMDPKASRGVHRLVGALAQLCNRVLGGDLRFQSLPNVFDLWVDGIEVPVFEEFGAGTAALHLDAPAARAALLRDPAYRRRFKREWASRWLGRAYHRDLDEARIVACPEPELVGLSFGAVARRRGVEPVDALLDLAAAHGNALRWTTVVGNDRARWLQWIVAHPAVLIGFSDAGAHLRNMAFYNYPLRMLRLVHDAERAGSPFMTLPRAVQRLTGEIAAWLGLDVGVLAPGKRGDVVVVDPQGLGPQLDELHDAPMPGFAGLRRLVRRHDGAVRAVIVGGRVAFRGSDDGRVDGGTFAAELGESRGFGRLLRV